mmetsp:Transcript_12564/g.27248  ORF Transcript_12564/g.27248 Transcript_12564/m.27248 type:complete len:1558 (+) Transcript_12564:111-4784(+)
MVIVPRKNDVLLGKGTAINTHCGNKHFRATVELQKPQFQQSKRADKRKIAESIINEIQKLGGRFLMEDPNSKSGAHKGDGNNMNYGSGVNNPVRANHASPDDFVSDPFILEKVWVRVEREKVLGKVMHRLRDKKVSVGQKHQLIEQDNNLEMHPPDTKSPARNLALPNKVETVDETRKAPQSEYGKAGPQTKVESRNQQYYKTDHVTSQTRSTLESLTDVPFPVGIQSILQPVSKRISTMESITGAPIKVGIQTILQPVGNHDMPMMENLTGAPAPTASHAIVPVSIQYWIRSAVGLSISSDDYLKGAVNLSWLLTKHLMQLIAASEITLLDISIEKVIIFVDPPLTMQSPSSLPIKAVQFQPSVRSFLSMAQHAQSASSLHSPRAACAALGGILLEIFSKGRSSSPETSSGTNNTLDTTQYNQQAIMPPAQRRKLAVPMAGSISAMANSILLEVGMPISICRLVCDLLDAINEPCPGSALTSMEEVLWGLTQMKDDPEHFLFDCLCPQKALDDTCLFHGIDRDYLFGREKELAILMNAKKNISSHVQRVYAEDPLNIGERSNAPFGQEIRYLCEAAFLSGYAGSGKSSLLQPLICACNQEGWFVVSCKFDKQIEPIKSVSKGFDDFFGTWATDIIQGRSNLDPAMVESFHQVRQSISSTIAEEGLCQLCEIMPNLGRAFPGIATATNGHSQDQRTSSIDKVGSAVKRRTHLFHVLFKAICSVGRPVLITYDDIQWASSMESWLKEFIVNYTDLPCATQKEARHQGLLSVGTFRSNEVGENQGIIETIASVEQSKSARVTRLVIGELAQDDIGKLISRKLCLPMRYTRDLARLIFSKTRGNPFFVKQFLKSIIENRMLEFSVNSRRWTWTCDVIDKQMISDGVAQLMTTRFIQLPHHLMQTVTIVSCFGSQVDNSTIDLLNIGHQLLPFNMQDALELAIKEGILEKADTIYQFTHDLIKQTVYESILTADQQLLHKTIGTILLRSAADNPTTHLIAVDQINIYCKGAILSPEERSQYAEINATAAKFSIAGSTFEQARSYISIGMKMLGSNHWEDQYTLSLKLYEMSASISCIKGDIGAMASCLNETIANAKSFEDSLTSSSLLAKLLASSSKCGEAMGNCLLILSTLGEDFPQDVTLPMVLNELSVIQTTLANITVEQVKLIPRMTEKSKLYAMQFLSMLCSYSIIAKPMLVPILSCRMVRLTIENGFCDDSIVGLVTAGYGLFSFTDDEQLGYRIGKVGESLIEESPNRHALRSRLCLELDITLKILVEPVQSVISTLPDRYNSAMHAGDVGTALQCRRLYCNVSFFAGTDLTTTTKQFVTCIQQLIKYQQTTVLYSTMSSFRACMHLTGQSNVEVDVKSYEELNEIAEKTNNKRLLYQNFIYRMFGHFFMGDYLKVMELSGKYKPSGLKHISEVVRFFFEGIASFSLARHTHQLKWRSIGEKSLEKILKWEKLSTWNFETMAKLLQAELHYLNGELKSADVAYRASIVSAREHKFTHYEALAYELHGIYFVENKIIDKGRDQLQMALDKYKQWGAMKKANEVQLLMDAVDTALL